MRISLLNPPPIQGTPFIREGRCMQSVDSWAAVWPPLTLAILAAVARKHGAVDLFDCNVEPGYDVARVVDRLRRFAPDVVVVNTSFPSIEGDAACAAAIKAACPDSLLVGYGVFHTLLDQQAMVDVPVFDVGLVGEPEVTFDELLGRVGSGRSVADVPGVLSRRDGAIHAAPPRPLVQDLDELPFAARDLLRNDRYRLPHDGHPFTLVNVARGCPYPCIYCIAPLYYGRKLRRHSLEYVLAELEECQRRYGLRDFLFWEEIFTLDRTFGLRLCEAICRKGWTIEWATTTRVDAVDAEILTAMKRAGCQLLGLGIETASQEILDAARKRQTLAEVRHAVRLCRRAGVRTMGHFIFGLPGETPDTVDATVAFAASLDLDYLQCYAAVPYPKTALGEMARERGWLRSRCWNDYDFGGASILDVGTITPAQVDAARTRMFRRFYLRPRFLARQVRHFTAHPRQLWQARKFLRWMTNDA